VYSTTGGLETDSANLTFNGTTLTANTLNLTNALGTTYGGTGLTSFTSGGVVYASSSSALATGSRLTFDGSEIFTNSGGTIQYNDIKGSSAAGTRLSAGGTLGTDSFDLFQNTSIAGIYNRASTPIAFAISSTEQMRLTSTGLGIGTSSPAYKLHVQNNAANTDTFVGQSSTVGLFTQWRYNATTASAYGEISTYGGANNLYIQNQGSNGSVFICANGGNVGIGTSSPSQKLTVANGQITVTNSGAVNPAINFAGNGSGASGFQIGQNYNAQTLFVYDNAASSQRLTLDSSGNLGIGTSSPGYKLDVQSASNGFVARFKGGSTGQAGLFYSDPTEIDFSDAAGLNNFGLLPGSNVARIVTNGTERARIDSSGNLGLGVTPSAWATVTPVIELKNGVHFASLDTGTPLAYFGANCYYNGSNWIYKVSSNYAVRYEINAGGNGSHAWFTAPSGTAGNAITFTQAMTLDVNGSLLLGTTSTTPSAGGVVILSTGATSSPRTVADHASGTASGNSYANFTYAGTVIGSITQNGTTGVLYNITSDQRLKENIQDAESASDLIDAIQVRQFDWKSDGSHQRYGFVAQELVTVAPEAVNQPADPDEMMAVDYSKLVPMLVKEIQSLRIRISQLENKL
jgi:hypothetical protein